MNEAPEIPGADELIRWFGHWPNFHDFEVISIELTRSHGSRVRIHAFERTSDMDPRGYYVLAKHAIVTFSLEGFPLDRKGTTNTRIDFFNHQNVLSGARIEKTTGGYVLILDGIFGVDGSISCERMSVTLQPGTPEGGRHEPPAEV